MLDVELGRPRFRGGVRQTVKIRLERRGEISQWRVSIVNYFKDLEGTKLKVSVLGRHGCGGVGQQIVSKDSMAQRYLDMLNGVVSRDGRQLVIALGSRVVDPLGPVGFELLGGAEVHDKGVGVLGLRREPGVVERVIEPVPTMVLQMRPRLKGGDERTHRRHGRRVSYKAEGEPVVRR